MRSANRSARALAILCLSLFGLSGCATSFKGDAKFPGGPRGCYDRCEQAGLMMTNYVFVGEYSTGCVCSLKAKSASAAIDGPKQHAASAATAAAAVAVMRQMEAQQAAQNAAFFPAPGMH
jgi:hypothetical protein